MIRPVLVTPISKSAAMSLSRAAGINSNKGGKRQRDNSRVSNFVDVYRFFFELLNLALNFERLRLASALFGILKF